MKTRGEDPINRPLLSSFQKFLKTMNQCQMLLQRAETHSLFLFPQKDFRQLQRRSWDLSWICEAGIWNPTGLFQPLKGKVSIHTFSIYKKVPSHTRCQVLDHIKNDRLVDKKWAEHCRYMVLHVRSNSFWMENNRYLKVSPFHFRKISG